MSPTRFNNTPFFASLRDALKELLESKGGERLRVQDAYAAIAADERYHLPDGRPRFTEGQVKSGLRWLADNNPAIATALGGPLNRTRLYWALPKE